MKNICVPNIEMTTSTSAGSHFGDLPFLVSGRPSLVSSFSDKHQTKWYFKNPHSMDLNLMTNLNHQTFAVLPHYDANNK